MSRTKKIDVQKSSRRGRPIASVSLTPRLTLTSLRIRPVDRLPFPLGEDACSLFSDFRSSLSHGLRAVGLGTGDRVLVPALHDGAEVDVLTSVGVQCVFYDAGSDVLPQEAELESLLDPAVRALYLVHHLGFPQDAEYWHRWCDARGLFLIEDCSQAWMASRDGCPVGSWGEVAVFFLPNTLPLPDGSAVLAPSPARSAPTQRSAGLTWLVRRTRALDRLITHGNATHETSPEETYAALRQACADGRASARTRYLLPRLAELRVAARRRAHYEQLLDDLGDLVPHPFADLPAGASPFVFPIEVEDPHALLDRLHDAGINAKPLWPASRHLEAEDFPNAVARRSRGIALPVHQETTPSQLERMARTVRGRRTAAPRWELEILPSLEALGDEWDDLALASRNIFATREWLTSWWRHRPADAILYAAACRTAGGRLVAILPLYESAERGARVLRFVGYGPSDQLGPVCAPEDRRLAARALREFLAEIPARWDLLLANDLPGDQAWDALLGGRLLKRAASPVVWLNGDRWDDFLGTLGSRLRQEIRYDARRLQRDHEVQFRLADDPARLDEDLDRLFELHAGRWQEESGFTTWEPFHRQFARTALASGWLRLWLLELDGRTVAAKFNYRFAGAEYSYQSARDIAFKQASLGLVMLAHAMRTAMEEGVREYRFLRGGERHKLRFPTEDPGVETVALAHGPIRAAALSIADNLRGVPVVKRRGRWVADRLSSG